MHEDIGAPPVRPPDERLLDRFVPVADHRGRHQIRIRAPAELVFAVACDLDMRAHPLVRAVFRLREILLRSTAAPRRARGLLEETTALGWRVLALRPGRELVMGAVTQPWRADVVFRPVPPHRFAAFAEPYRVKIAWTLEAEPLGPELTRFATETRVRATDERARRRFARYWLVFAPGILLIRLLLLPQVRREAERRHRAAPATRGGAVEPAEGPGR